MAINETRQYLTFMLAGEIFATDVAKVREILEWANMTKVPQMPGYMCGVINLRGAVVPVVDMRLKFGMSAYARTVNTCIIVVEVSQGGETIVLGALADSVQEVVELEPSQIEPPPRIGSMVDTECIEGMGRQNEAFIMILDMDKVFSAEELNSAGTSLAA